MSLESWLLDAMELDEAERDARDEWVANWADQHRSYLLKGMLETDVSTLLAEVDWDGAFRLNRALYLLMAEGEQYELTRLINELVDAEMNRLALAEWKKRKLEPEDIEPEGLE